MLTKERVLSYIAVGRLLHTVCGTGRKRPIYHPNGRWTGGFYQMSLYFHTPRAIHTLEHSDLIIRPGRPS